MTLTDEDFAVELNGESIMYSISVGGSSGLDTMKFKDYVVSTDAVLQEGENVITLKTLENSLAEGKGGSVGAGAPMIDCIKVKTDATLTGYNSHKDNPSKRGGE